MSRRFNARRAAPYALALVLLAGAVIWAIVMPPRQLPCEGPPGNPYACSLDLKLGMRIGLVTLATVLAAAIVGVTHIFRRDTSN